MNRTFIGMMLLFSAPAIAEQNNPFFIRAFDGRFVCAQDDALVLCDKTQRTAFQNEGSVLQSPYGNMGEFVFETIDDGKVYIKSAQNAYLRANIISGVVDQVDSAQEWEKFRIVKGTAVDRAKFIARKYANPLIKKINQVALPAAQERLQQLQALWNRQTPETRTLVETAGLMVGMTTFVVVGLKYTWPRG